MTTLIILTPHLAFVLGVAMMASALHLYSETRPHMTESNWRKVVFLFCATVAMPSLASAAVTTSTGVDLKTATESGNAIIMYLAGTFAAVGIVTAGVAMMMGRQSIAKWAFVGAMVCGLGFAIVKTMWSNMGMEASDVGSFTP